LVHSGATLLKHQFVSNPVKIEGQCEYLPFRESAEFVVRAAWSRITRQRDVFDVLLSVIGQAYATYASNRDAYDRLRFIYEELLGTMQSSEDMKLLIMNRLTHDDIKKVRQYGITEEDLCNGFPHWDTLVQKNVYDPSYQETTVLPLDYNSLLEISEDWFMTV